MLTRRVVDVLMTILLLLLMSLQIMEQVTHEYIGFAMIAVVVTHQYLNRKWFTTLFTGRYGAVRVLSLVINLALITAFILSAISGMIISETFLFIDLEDFTEWGRTVHVASSYWAFVLMGFHVGMHWGMIACHVKAVWPKVLAVLFSGYGLYRLVIFRMMDYLTMSSNFVFLDYEKNPALVMFENLAMLAFCTLLGYQASRLAARPRDWMKPASVIAGACVVCGVLVLWLGGPEEF